MAVLKSLAVALLAGLLIAPASARAATPREYQVKAVFLYNFARFVEWPESAFADPKAPLVVGVFGFDPFGADLDEAVRGETVRGHPLVVRRVRSAAEAADCQIVFIHSSERNRLDDLLTALDKRSTLTVSDADGAAQKGVMIRLLTQAGRIRMRINVESARAAQLTISSNLLRSAEIVGGNSSEAP
jgi:YfiR/HmsC-like